MVRKIKVIDVYEAEETTRANEDEQQEQANEPIEAQEPEAAINETSADTEVDAAAAAVEEPNPKPIDTKTTSKTVQQVSCQACGKYMSLKNLRYVHSRYCTARAPEEPPPKITAPEPIEEPPPEKPIKKAPAKRAKAKAKPQPTEEEQPDQPTIQNNGILPPGLEAPYKGQMDLEETPDQFWRRTMKDLKDKKNLSIKNMFKRILNINY